MLRREWLTLAAALLGIVSVNAADMDPGLKAGDSPKSFNVKAITGPDAGESLCYV